MSALPERSHFIDEYRGVLCGEASSIGVDLTTSQCERLLTHLWLVLDANEKVNLTALTNPREAITKHLIDSLLFLCPYCSEEGLYLDMGTGAGYPGIVLEIMHPRPGVLLDARGKKIEACRFFCEELDLAHVQCIASRVEEYAKDHKEGFQTITARALAPLEVLLEYAQPLLAFGGCLIAGKGVLGEDEWEHGDEVAGLLGMSCVSRETFQLPCGAGHRELLIFQKVGAASVRLPRRAGMATKRPL